MAKRKVQSQEKLLIRLPDGMRQRIAEAARANGRSMTAEVVIRIAASLDMEPPELAPGEVPTSPTARHALALSEQNGKAIKALEARLAALERQVAENAKGRKAARQGDLLNK